MAKQQPNTTAAQSTRQVTFCTECGSPLGGHAASLAVNPSVKFCPECGWKLDDDNKCPNPSCPLFGTVPPGLSS